MKMLAVVLLGLGMVVGSVITAPTADAYYESEFSRRLHAFYSVRMYEYERDYYRYERTQRYYRDYYYNDYYDRSYKKRSSYYDYGRVCDRKGCYYP